MLKKAKSFLIWVFSALLASGLVFVVPVILVLAGDGWPGPRSIPTGDEIQEVFGPGGMTDVRVLAMVVLAGWLTWLHVIYVFAVEFVAALRGRTAHEVKASGLSQRLARMLVAGLFRLGATSTAVFGVAGPAAGVGLVAATAAPAGADVGSAERVANVVLVPESMTTDTTIEYFSEPVVSPRDGMVAFEVHEGDMLWSIAETHLGDGFRYREIFEASKGFEQPGADFRSITDPDLIWAGSILLLPADAVDVPPVEESKVAAVYGVASETVTTTRPTEETTTVEQGDVAGESSGVAASAAKVAEALSRDVQEPEVLPPPIPEPVVADAANEPADLGVDVVERVGVDGPSRPSMKLLGFGATGVVLAAGLVSRLRKARLRRQTRLEFGEVPGQLSEDEAELENEIRHGADTEFVSFIGSAWASLSMHQIDPSNVVVPVVASLDEDRLQVQMSGVDLDVFSPWRTQVDTEQFSVWELDRDGWQDYGLPAESPAAFPLLVAIASRSFLNFEATGPVSLLGDPERSAGFVRAVCMERAGVLQDGFDLRVSSTVADSIGVGDVHSASSIAADVESWASRTIGYLDANGMASSFVARAGIDTAEPFSMMVVCAAEDLAEMGPVLSRCAERRLPLAMIVMGRFESEFVIDIDTGGGVTFGPSRMRDSDAAYVQVDLAPLVDDLVAAHSRVDMLPADEVGEPQVVAVAPTFGTELPAPPLLPAASEPPDWVDDSPLVGGLAGDSISARDSATESGSTVVDGDATGMVVPVVDEAEAPLASEREPDIDLTVFDNPEPAEDIAQANLVTDAAIRLRVLGPVTLEGVEADLTSAELSLFTFLAINGEQTAATLRDALWGFDGVSDEGWWQMCRRTRNKVTASVFPAADSGRYVVHGVRTDFFEFQAHTKRARDGDSPDARIDAYLDALGLVSGEPLRVPGKEQYWSWVHSTEQGMLNHIEIQISDAVRGCIEAAVEANRLADAALACQQGLKASPLNEPVIEMYVEVLLAQGKRTAAQRLVDEYERRAFELFDGEPSSGPRDVLSSKVA